ncbi:helicase C-terminal domain-containing protein, partial [Escherichia coli]
KFTFGQQWPLAKMIGHTLDSADRSNVKRTSSQDAGVDHAADLIVATASLEVGFNYPNVGAVIQHKAPRDNAQFLQRKGRAGR